MPRKFLTFFLLLGLLGTARADVNFYVDPSRLGVGARALGMGKASLGIHQDVSSMFVNPAALANLKEWGVTSLSGRFINTIDYSNAGWAAPTRFGVIGIGVVNSGLGMTTPVATLETIDGEIRVVPSTTEAASYNYNTRVILLSYSRCFFLENLYLGGNLKFYSTDYSGHGSSYTSTGQDIDVSALYQINPRWNIGGVVKNALPFNAGGKLTYSDGYEESIGSSITLGTSFKVDPRFTLYLDYDTSLYSFPSLWHAGVEFWLNEIVAFRLGMDQEIAGEEEASNNLAAGLGLRWRGYSFDYAYHEYNNLPEHTTHYFSLGYSAPPSVPRIPFVLFDPKDRFVTDEATVWATGEVQDLRKVSTLKINADEVGFDATGFFVNKIDLELKLNRVSIEAFDKDGKLVKSRGIKGLRLRRFSDVSPPYFALWPIEYLATLDIITGYPNGEFKPLGNITRAEMCTLLMKTRGVREEGRGVGFKDVPEKHWAAPYIAEAAGQGVVKGYPDETFRPSGLITRAEGAAMIARFDGLSGGEVLEPPFPDVPGRHWAAKEITRAKEAGLLEYLEGKNFELNRNLTRGETAEILFRTGTIEEKIGKLWED